ncbi:MAG TPA: SMP-30/gluconolactonase/LRE family protein [Flavisolibacter sp.]|nr:SMP-30/gluconolactonase/LRE family protein [Flavisolibacter sp.]
MRKLVIGIGFLTASLLQLKAQELRQLSVDKPLAIADLKTEAGSQLLQAKWYVQPAHIRDAAFQAPGPSSSDPLPLYPTGAALQTHTLHPQINAADFDKGFTEVKSTDLELRQGTGLISFVWYKTELTIPPVIGKLNTTGTTAVFEIVIDDYSEIWVNGKQAQGFGQTGNGLISGYNARNRVVLTNNAKPGEHFTIAILAANGPLGKIPDNYIWVRNAVVDFYKELPAPAAWKDYGKVYTVDPALNKVLTPDTKIEKLADGFQFTEGPVWHPDGYLLFSDPNTNSIYRYNPKNHNITIYMSHSGYTGTDIGEFGQPGSNGLTIDKEGRLIVCQHGNRRVIRHEKKGPVTVLVDKIDGKRLNSPNDLVLRSDGTLYITDPPYGLPMAYNDPRKELDYQGVIMYKDGKAQVVAKDCGGPNGIAFSPDEKYLYVTNWDIRAIHTTKTIWRYEVNADGTLKNGKVFYDMNQTEDDEALDGLKIDKEGNLFASAPGGIWIIAPSGKLLGKIVTPERPANMAWGDEDGKTLYLTAHSSLYKVRVLTGGKFAWQ